MTNRTENPNRTTARVNAADYDGDIFTVGELLAACTVNNVKATYVDRLTYDVEGDSDNVRAAITHAFGAAVADDLLGEYDDPDLCAACQEHPNLGEGTYGELCRDCAYEAHKEDEGDRIRSERKEGDW